MKKTTQELLNLMNSTKNYHEYYNANHEDISSGHMKMFVSSNHWQLSILFSQ